jgi:hypothetical protein
MKQKLASVDSHVDRESKPSPIPPDQLFPLPQLPAREWMPRKGGRPLSYFTCLRWAINGKGGVKLKTLMVGGQRCTCDSWAMMFFEALTNGNVEPAKKPSPHDHDQALRELEAAGID